MDKIYMQLILINFLRLRDLNLSKLIQFEHVANISSVLILATAALMVSKVPTYSLKRIVIPRRLTVFLLLGIGIYLGFLIFYTFSTLFLTGLVYVLLIPISYFHYRHLNKKSLDPSSRLKEEDEETEDIL